MLGWLFGIKTALAIGSLMTVSMIKRTQNLIGSEEYAQETAESVINAVLSNIDPVGGIHAPRPAVQPQQGKPTNEKKTIAVTENNQTGKATAVSETAPERSVPVRAERWHTPCHGEVSSVPTWVYHETGETLSRPEVLNRVAEAIALLMEAKAEAERIIANYREERLSGTDVPDYSFLDKLFEKTKENATELNSSLHLAYSYLTMVSIYLSDVITYESNQDDLQDKILSDMTELYDTHIIHNVLCNFYQIIYALGGEIPTDIDRDILPSDSHLESKTQRIVRHYGVLLDIKDILGHLIHRFDNVHRQSVS